MNQVGIGQLKHAQQNSAAKQAAVRIAKTSKPSISSRINSRKRNNAEGEKDGKREGQLAVDIVQTDTEMIVICPIAGVENSDIKVAIQDDVLTIRGERKKITGVEDKQALVNELFWGTFSRSIVLPDHIDRKNIAARVHEHMLIITIPKTEDFKTRIIHINEEA